MDLLFHRYANPFVLLDEMILCGDLAAFIDVMTQERVDEINWQYYLAKVFNQSFLDFKESLLKVIKPPEVNLKTTIQDSRHMLDGFIPTERA